jgi:hypothetical protein
MSSLICGLYEEFIPVRTINIRACDPHWFNNKILDMINPRNFIYDRWKRTKKCELFEEYKALRNKTNNLIKKAKAQFCARRLSPTLPSKVFWKNLKSLSGLPSKKNYPLNDYFSADDLNDYFCDYSSSITDTIDFNQLEPIEEGFSFKNFDIT